MSDNIIPNRPAGYDGQGNYVSPHRAKSGGRYEKVQLPDGRWITRKINAYSR